MKTPQKGRGKETRERRDEERKRGTKVEGRRQRHAHE